MTTFCTWQRAGLLGAILLTLLAGCSTRSISDSGYRDRSSYVRPSADPFYNGELTEFDVLGIDLGSVQEAEIAAALDESNPVLVRPGQSLMVIQSGALLPDEAMLADLRLSYSVGAFSGIPVRSDATGDAVPGYARSLRLAAARGGYTTIFCYWGKLETQQQNLATKAVSWVPIAGRFVPDEMQEMRIVLKGAVVDVATGAWAMLAPRPVTTETATLGLIRGSQDQEQVAALKKAGYAELVRDLRTRFQ